MKTKVVIILFLIMCVVLVKANATAIYDIQYTENSGFQGFDCYPSPLNGDDVSITGVVTAFIESDSSFYIQDADSLWSGIHVWFNNDNISRGDSVSFSAEVYDNDGDFSGYTYLDHVTSLTILESSVSVFDALEIESGDLAQSCNESSEAYEGMLVRLSNVEIITEVDGNNRWTVDDGSGAVYIGNEYHTTTPAVGETIVSLTGVVSSFKANSEIYYIIYPRDAGDIEFEGGNRPPDISNVTATPSSPTSLDDVTVTAAITDDSGVESASVRYGINDNSAPNAVAMSHEGNTYSGIIPAADTSGWIFYRVSATDDSNSTANSPLDSLQIIEVVSMAEIQSDPSAWSGEMVTCQGVVTIGIDILQTDRLNAYFQDNSGRGLNLFSFNVTPEYTQYIKRGFLIRAYGELDYYQSTLMELKDPDITFIDSLQPLPSPQKLTTAQAAEQDWSASLVVVSGAIMSIGNESGGGRNIMVDDGSGEVTVRVWNTTDIEVDNLVVGDTYTVIGIGGEYNNTKQIVPGYPEDIYPGIYVPEGIGIADISPVNVRADETGLTETITILSDSSVTLDIVKVVLPSGWVWESANEDGVELYGDGMDTTAVAVTIESNSIRINGTAITETASGVIRIKNLKSPVTPGAYTFQVLTSYQGNTLEEIANSPQVTVEGAKEAFVDIPPKVIIPDYGEEITITFAAPTNSDMLVQIYDIEGNLIATLLDEAYDPTVSEVVWDGRDRLNEIVPIGVYICYVEATERPSGLVTSAKAPIVVAVPLK